jgi:hypothetical protein
VNQYHLTVVLSQTRNPSQKMTARTRRAPDTSLGAVSALQASMGSVSTPSSCTERNMIDELAPRLVHGSYR